MKSSPTKHVILRPTDIAWALVPDAFREAVSSVLLTISGADVLRPSENPEDNTFITADFVATVEFQGALAGTLGIAIERDLARRLTASLAWSRPEEFSNADIGDGVKEIVNQISGRFSTLLAKKNCRISISTPGISERRRSDAMSPKMSGPAISEIFTIENQRLTAFLRGSADH